VAVALTVPLTLPAGGPVSCTVGGVVSVAAGGAPTAVVMSPWISPAVSARL
jgi:hypothetical protein